MAKEGKYCMFFLFFNIFLQIPPFTNVYIFSDTHFSIINVYKWRHLKGDNSKQLSV